MDIDKPLEDLIADKKQVRGGGGDRGGRRQDRPRASRQNSDRPPRAAVPYARPPPRSTEDKWVHDMGPRGGRGGGRGGAERGGDVAAVAGTGAVFTGVSPKILVSGIHYEVSAQDLKNIFSQAGTLEKGPTIRQARHVECIGPALEAGSQALSAFRDEGEQRRAARCTASAILPDLHYAKSTARYKLSEWSEGLVYIGWRAWCYIVNRPMEGHVLTFASPSHYHPRQIIYRATRLSTQYDRSGRSTGEATMEFSSYQEAKNAINKFDGAMTKGQTISIRLLPPSRRGPPAGAGPGAGAAATAAQTGESLLARMSNNGGGGGGARSAKDTRAPARGNAPRGRGAPAPGGGRGNGAPRGGRRGPATAGDLDKELDSFMAADKSGDVAME